MAFNPFTTFQKNQKFWMAAILMICMVTFVFCTGSRGDLWDAIGRGFKGTGPAVVTVAGRNYSQYDLSQLRDQRNVVNDYMRAGADFAVRNITDKLQQLSQAADAKDAKKKKEQDDLKVQLGRIQLVLSERMRRPRYFEGGVKLDDLVEFKLWEGLADKLNIRLLPEDVRFMIRAEFFSPNYEFIHPQQLFEAERIAMGHRDIGGSNVMFNALTREFRVRLARLAYMEMRPGYLQGAIPIPGTPTEQRVPVSLAQLWKVYQDKRSEFDVTLIPVHVEDFAKEIAQLKGPPTQGDLEKLFDKYKRNKFDPESPLPSFETPEEVRAEFIMADPTVPIYVAATQAVTLLQQAMPAGAAGLQSPLVTAGRVGAFGAARQKLAADVLEGMGGLKFRDFGGPSLLSGDIDWPLAAHLASRDPRAIASLVGGITGSIGVPALPGAMAWSGFLAVPAHFDAATLQAGLTEESQRRLLPSAKVAATFATGQPAGVLGVTLLEFFKPPLYGHTLLPLPVIAAELEQVMENRTAERWASRNMITVKRMLDRNLKPEAVKLLVKDVVPKYNFRHAVTAKFHNKYNIDKAPELAPLRAAFEHDYTYINQLENRSATPERLLKDTDFYKLFFDSSEPFAAAATPYQVRPWPPDIHPNQMQLMGMDMPGANGPDEQPLAPNLMADIEKFKNLGVKRGETFSLLPTAQKPALFWRHDKRSAEFPKTLADAKDRVIQAWEKELAREHKALPLAKELADKLRKTEGEFPPDVRDSAAQKAGHAKIVLDRIAPLVPKQAGDLMFGGHRNYFPYHLPKNAITYPRDDMVKQLLSLFDLKAPIEIKTGQAGGEPAFVKQLNDINKELFDAVKQRFPKDPQGKFVQVLTNKPQNIYYVAMVTRWPSADAKDFQDFVLRYASEAPMRPVDSFVTRAQELVAKDFHAELIQQLQQDVGYTAQTDLEETKKTFDREEHGG
jgi:hypothetical protein